MTEVITNRLRLFPLNEEQLQLAITDFNALEESLNLLVTDKNIGEREEAVYKIRLKDMQDNLKHYMWYTPWMLVDKQLNRIIGAIMIKNYPDVKGEVLIGYAMQEDFRRKGYMKEAVKELIDWIFLNKDTNAVIADTLISNEASFKLLEQLGMNKYKEDGECYWWRLERK